MEKEKLERMLEAVKEVKSRVYVGTLEAYRSIKFQRNLFNLHDIVAEAINIGLSKLTAELTYRATPERVYGFYGSLVDIDDFDNKIISHLAGEHCFPFEFRDHCLVYYSDEEDLRKASDYFLKFFKEANLVRISSDEEVGSLLAAIIRREYDKIRNSIERENLCEYDKQVSKFIDGVRNYDWTDGMSHDWYIHDIQCGLLDISIDELKTEDIIERIKKEMIDNRLEYRRMILAKILNEDTVYHVDVLKLPRSWISFIGLYDKFIKSATENLLKYLNESKPDNPEIEKLEKKLIRCRFIRELLAREKNWINKFLKA